jgi:hypothetical protein
MNCEKILDTVFEHAGEEPLNGNMSFLTQLRVNLHLLFCPDCARQLKRFNAAWELLRDDFLPPAPGLEDSIMAMITLEEEKACVLEQEETTAYALEVPGGLSTKGWVIAGLILLVSLATAFFSFDFNHVALEAGISFLLPVGITIGIVLTSYGALFIGSHLKELTERFDL